MNNVQPNVIGNYIKVTNMSSPPFLMRYRGTSVFPHILAEFLSLPFSSGQTKLTSFPNYAQLTVLVFEVYSFSSQVWTEFYRTQINFPGTFCYNVTGSPGNPQVTNVPCNERISLTNDLCVDNSCKRFNGMYSVSDTLCCNVNDICNNTRNILYRPTPNPLNNYIRVFNKTTSSPLIRYRGVSSFPSLNAEFIALPFLKDEDVLTSFPTFAGLTTIRIERYDLTTQMWVSIFGDYVNFPGTFCYEVIENLGNIQVNRIPCPPI